MNNLLFPLQLKRQYTGPLDSDSLFISVEAMEMFKTSPLIYFKYIEFKFLIVKYFKIYNYGIYLSICL